MSMNWSEGTARTTRMIRPESSEGSARVPFSFELQVIDGPDAGKTFAIEPSTVILVGSSKLCAIRLEDETVAADRMTRRRLAAAEPSRLEMARRVAAVARRVAIPRALPGAVGQRPEHLGRRQGLLFPAVVENVGVAVARGRRRR